MRQRKLRNLDAKYEAYSDIIVDAPAEMRGRWAELSGVAPLFIEIGCGKGKFISELAAREPDRFFVAIEGNKSVMLRAMEKIRNADRPIRVLNLFAYTGGATVAAAKAGASVVHVDAAKGMVAQAKENAALSGLAEAPIRYIVDDCKKFVEREIRRGNHYEGIIMDPPSYGRGPGGEVWKLEDCIDELIGLTAQLLSPEPLFFLVNSYTTGLSPLTMSYLIDLKIRSRFGGHVEAGELGLRVTQTGAYLPCGASTRWTL